MPARTAGTARHRHVQARRSGPNQPPEERCDSDDDGGDEGAQDHPDQAGREVSPPPLGLTPTEDESPQTLEVALERVLTPGRVPSWPVDLAFEVRRRQTATAFTRSDALGSHDADDRRRWQVGNGTSVRLATPSGVIQLHHRWDLACRGASSAEILHRHAGTVRGTAESAIPDHIGGASGTVGCDRSRSANIDGRGHPAQHDRSRHTVDTGEFRRS